MNSKSLGMLFLVLIVIVFLFSLFKNTKEFMTNPDSDWVQNAKKYENTFGANKFAKHAEYPGGPIPLPEGEMLIFANNKVSPECCGSATYSTSDGCICTSLSQLEYINKRGGNRTAYGGTSMF